MILEILLLAWIVFECFREDDKIFFIVEDDEDEKSQIDNIRGRDALDHYFLSLPRGYYSRTSLIRYLLSKKFLPD